MKSFLLIDERLQTTGFPSWAALAQHAAYQLDDQQFAKLIEQRNAWKAEEAAAEARRAGPMLRYNELESCWQFRINDQHGWSPIPVTPAEEEDTFDDMFIERVLKRLGQVTGIDAERWYVPDEIPG